MADLRFEWDPEKAEANFQKHFADERALLIDDPEHSDDEDRFILLGLSAALRTLVVCHCYREKENAIRLISARKATKRERGEYEKRWSP